MGAKAALHMLRLPTILLVLLLAVVVTPASISAQGACEAMPRGAARTDCFIARARIAHQKAILAYDKARMQSDGARLRAATGTSMAHYRAVCHGKGAGTRACYRMHGLWASRCL